jgi:hypothetical protein
VQQHQQVFLSYGPLPNSQLLLFYGFALPGNPFEQQQLTIEPGQVPNLLRQQKQQQQRQDSEGLQVLKLLLLQELQLPERFTLTVQQPLPHGLMDSLRLLYADSTEVHAVQLAAQQYRQQQAAAGLGGTTVKAAAAATSNSAGGRSKGDSKGKARGSSGCNSGNSTGD